MVGYLTVGLTAVVKGGMDGRSVKKGFGKCNR